ncbi:thrombospondin type 3 repeat-containing protein [Marinobacter zhejiangensis]|uniref:Thrombospondin type 3 repeat-containing protein n=1 Tax=Marinobacter zhejiangensis TaxID=488535 RepID=A0A1I4THX2_9GAMM|nr:thrombospondin type 3 repeat-containing protein [Marinobacter zhejiangensis]SFM76306.1 Thrombospondin type 3 repeat-containing protein [Marinobacter zhejiangensis]
MNNSAALWTLPLALTLAACNVDVSTTEVTSGQPDSETPTPVKDFDSDGVADSTDNCLLVPNADQANSNGDALGDACDIDTPVVEGKYQLTIYHELGSEYLDAASGVCVSATDSPFTVDVLVKGSQVFLSEEGGERRFYGIADTSGNLEVFTHPEGQFAATNGYFSEGTRRITFDYSDQQSSKDGTVSCNIAARVEANFNYATSLIAPAAMVPPGLSPGDTFYIVFVTSAGTVANLSVDGFNLFVNDVADGSSLKGTDNGDLQWKAILGHDDGTIQGENLFSVGSASPIYNLNGDRVANNASDFFNGGMLNPIEYDETGTSLGDVDVSVGLTQTGSNLIVQGDQTLGGNDSQSDGCSLGRSGRINSQAFAMRASSDDFCDSIPFPLYSVSPLLEVPSAP